MKHPSPPLAPPLGPARHIVQQLTAQWQGREESLLCVLELDRHRIAMSGMTHEGLGLFDLTYDGHVLTSEQSPMLPDMIDPEWIIADLQLVFWPVAELQKLMPKPWRLVSDRSQRHVYFDDDHRVEIHYRTWEADWPSSVELVNHQHRYRLHIRTVSYEIVSE
ncbi:MAG: DUF3261 domain-containing protein [Gammaproteobacteria bacterium]